MQHFNNEVVAKPTKLNYILALHIVKLYLDGHCNNNYKLVKLLFILKILENHL